MADCNAMEWLRLLFVLAVMTTAPLLPVTQALDTSRCVGALGMESGAIKDDDVTASSSFDSSSVGPHNARVRVERNGGAWCPRQQATHQPRDWIEVDLRTDHVVTAVETQGRFGNGQGQEYAEHFLLEYWRDAVDKWVRYKDIKGEEVLQGNTNTYVAEKRDLDPVILARKIRFYPYSHHRRTVCMRIELYGCPWTEGIASYTMPQGDQRGTNWQFYDSTYDGIWDGSLLKQGLGQLTDGKLGPDNFKTSYYDNDRAQGWVGWRNDSRAGQPVEIVFEFDTVRDFTQLSIFTNNQFTKEVQIFSEVHVHFSVGGKIYPGDAIIHRPLEDRIFEHSRNVTVKLHHRVGKFVKLRLFFATKWILISEVSFRSEPAARNYTPETDASGTAATAATNPAAAPPGQGQDVWNQQYDEQSGTVENPTYLAVIIGVLVAVSFLLAAAIFFMILRHRQRKNAASPLPDKSGWTSVSVAAPSPRLPDASQGKKNGTLPYGDLRGDAAQFLLPPSGSPYAPNNVRTLSVRPEYQEPFHASRFSPCYSYSTLLLAGNNDVGYQRKPIVSAGSDIYDYAVPDIGNAPLIPPQPKLAATSPPPPHVIQADDKDAIMSSTNSSSSSSKSSKNPYAESPAKKSLDRAELLTALKNRADSLLIPEFPRSKLRLIQRIANGAFGTVYTAEAENIPEYGSRASIPHSVVAAKFLPNTSDKDKNAFCQEVRLLAALEDPNLSRVLAVCTSEEPFCVLLEYLEHGDLNQFLRSRRFIPDTYNSNGSRGNVSRMALPEDALSMGSLIFIAGQIASGMRYLESLNFVHRDLAARNCLVGKGLHVKICDFGTDNDAYADDYYHPDGPLLGLPIRWMAWESVIQGKYTTKSDVWSFGVTLWEILNMARQRPYAELDDDTVIANLQRFSQSTAAVASGLPKPAHCPRDIYDLMCECWKRSPVDRPSFREIHLFLQRKNLGYSPS